MAEFQPPEGLRKIVAEAIEKATSMTAMRHEDLADAVLAALFEACTVREDPHMWLGDGTRGGRSLILRFPLPDEPMPEPGPMPPELAAALARARAKLAGGEKGADGGHR